MVRWWRWSGEPGVGKSRLVYEFVHSHIGPRAGSRSETTSHVLREGAQPICLCIDLLNVYFQRRRAAMSRDASARRSPASC